MPTTSPWPEVTKPKLNENWDDINQVAMSTTSVSFTPTQQLSPQVSIRSED